MNNRKTATCVAYLIILSIIPFLNSNLYRAAVFFNNWCHSFHRNLLKTAGIVSFDMWFVFHFAYKSKVLLYISKVSVLIPDHTLLLITTLFNLDNLIFVASGIAIIPISFSISWSIRSFSSSVIYEKTYSIGISIFVNPNSDLIMKQSCSKLVKITVRYLFTISYFPSLEFIESIWIICLISNYMHMKI